MPEVTLTAVVNTGITGNTIAELLRIHWFWMVPQVFLHRGRREARIEGLSVRRFKKCDRP